MVAALAMAQPAAAGDRTLERYAEGTWRSFEAMTDAGSGLPSDILQSDGTRSVQTSTTNIGAYMWSAVVAEKLDIIRRSELVARMRRTVDTLEDLERHAPSGQFYNWYDHRTGEKLTTWPPSGEPLTPILSSVDNGWLAVGLKIVAERIPELSRRASALYDSMNFGFYYRPDVNRMLFHYVPDTWRSERAATTRSSARAGSPPTSASPRARCPSACTSGSSARSPTRCDWSWTETRPVGFTRTYFGTTVYDGSLPYADMLRDAELGRQHVRGADAGAVPARGALGTWELGRQPPAHRRRADPPRPGRGRLRLLGLLAGQRPRGRVHRVRRRRHRSATRPATRPTTTARSSTAAGRAAARPRAEPDRRRRLHQRRRHPARRVPRPALRAARDAGQPRPARARLRHLHALGLPGLGQRRAAAWCRTPTSRSTRA